MFQRILLPTDGSKSANQALKTAIKFSLEQKAVLRVIHVLEDLPWQFSTSQTAIDIMPLLASWKKSGEAILKQASSKAQKAGLSIETLQIEAIGESPAKLIHEEAKAWKADLIITGTHGRHGIERVFLGS
ncbi:MAG: universal stress protein, partial [Pseudomonadota bacterium]|nr:universal stress protein [Pseudomonadota bacterium]